MSQLKVHLRFHFKKPEKSKKKKCQEKDAFDVAVNDSLDDAMKGAPLNLFMRPLYLIQSRRNRIVDISNQIRKQTFTGVYSRLQKKADSYLFY